MIGLDESDRQGDRLVRLPGAPMRLGVADRVRVALMALQVLAGLVMLYRVALGERVFMLGLVGALFVAHGAFRLRSVRRALAHGAPAQRRRAGIAWIRR
jgi:hypothetical protein